MSPQWPIESRGGYAARETSAGRGRPGAGAPTHSRNLRQHLNHTNQTNELDTGFSRTYKLTRAAFLSVLRVTAIGAQLAILLLGLLAMCCLLSARAGNPIICVVQVEGSSMSPNLQDGERVVFAHLPWHVGSVVLADVGEEEPVIKRVVTTKAHRLLLVGDNWRVSKQYIVRPKQVMAVMMCKLPLHSKARVETASASADQWTGAPHRPPMP